MTGFSAADSDFRGVRVSELARSGNPVPDYAAGSEFINFRDAPILGDNFGDRVLFRGRVSTPSGNRDGLWYFLHGDSRIVRGIAAGDEVHRAPAGATLSTSDFSTLVYGPNASVAVSAVLQGGGVTSSNNRVVVAPRIHSHESGPEILTRQGDPAGFSGWQLGPQVSALAVNSWHNVSFNGRFTGTGVDASNEYNVWTSAGSGGPLARQGWNNDSVPGQPSNIYFISFIVRAINDANRTVFFAETYNRNVPGLDGFTARLILRGGGSNRQITSADAVPPGLASNYRFRLNPSGSVRMTGGANPWVVFADTPRIGSSSSGIPGIWRWRDGSMSEGVRSGSLITLPEDMEGISVTPVITDFAVNSRAEIALVTNRGIAISYPDGNLELRYRLGDRLPGMPEDGSGITHFETPTLSDPGRLAFMARYTADGATRHGFWVETITGLRLVAQTGVPLPGSGYGEVITSIGFRAGGHAAEFPGDASSPSGWHPANSVNAAERVVFRTGDASGRHVIWSADANAEFSPPALGITTDEGDLLDRENAGIDLGEATVGIASAPLILRIRNLGEAELSGLNAGIEGAHADDFSVEVFAASGGEREAVLHFTPQDSGVRQAVLRISSNDPAGDFQIILHGNGVAPVVPDFSDYTDSFGLEGEDALPAARPFPDGLPNLVRYAMNLSASPAPEDLPAARILAMDGAPHFAVEFRVRKNMPGTRLFPEFSANLQDWEEAHSQNIESLEDPDPETARFRVAFPLADGHRFIRFQATRGP